MLPPADQWWPNRETVEAVLADLDHLVDLLVDVELGLLTLVHLETHLFLGYPLGLPVLLACPLPGREVFEVVGVVLVEGLNEFLASLVAVILDLPGLLLPVVLLVGDLLVDLLHHGLIPVELGEGEVTAL